MDFIKTRTLSLLVIALFAASATATDHFVDAPASIQAAMNAAAPGDRILVGPGVYYEVIDFQGKQLEVIGTGGPNLTILDGSGFNSTVVRATGGEALGTTLQGFTLTNGAGLPFPSSYGFDYYGGGAHVGGAAQLLISDCVITNNGWGTGTFAGGVHCGGDGSHVDLVRCVINNNRAWASGGATLVDGHGTMTFNHCTVYGNSSNNFFGHQGGISMANHGTVIVRNSIVWGNAGEEIGAFGAPYDVGTFANVESSCVEGGYFGSNNLSANPLFLELVDFTISTQSPCVDVGDPAWGLPPDATLPDLGARWLGWSPPGVGVFCTSDPFITASCPCGNVGGQTEGCQNSTGAGAKLDWSGGSSISAASLTLSASQLVPNQLGLYFQGNNAVNGGSGVFFGDGVRCVGGGVVRLQVRTASATGTSNTTADLIAVGGIAIGDTKYFQLWYRDHRGTSCGSGFNLTHGVQITFTP